jgi:hypothetical protein
MKSPVEPEFYVKQSYHEPDNFDPFVSRRGHAAQDISGGGEKKFSKDDIDKALDELHRWADEHNKNKGPATRALSWDGKEIFTTPTSAENFSVTAPSASTPSAGSMFSRAAISTLADDSHKAAVNDFEQDPDRLGRCYICGQLCEFVSTGPREFGDPFTPDGHWQHQG